MIKFKIAVKGFILKDNKVLILKKNPKLINGKIDWDLAGGGIEAGETWEKALIRETKEETNLDIKIQNIIRCWSILNPKEGESIGYGITFLTNYVSGEVILSDEHDDYMWVELEDCKNLDIPQWIKDEAKLIKNIL